MDSYELAQLKLQIHASHSEVTVVGYNGNCGIVSNSLAEDATCSAHKGTEACSNTPVKDRWREAHFPGHTNTKTSGRNRSILKCLRRLDPSMNRPIAADLITSFSLGLNFTVLHHSGPFQKTCSFLIGVSDNPFCD